MRGKLWVIPAIPVAALVVLATILIMLIVYLTWPFQKLWGLRSQGKAYSDCNSYQNPVCAHPEIDTIGSPATNYLVALVSGTQSTVSATMVNNEPSTIVIEYSVPNEHVSHTSENQDPGASV